MTENEPEMPSADHSTSGGPRRFPVGQDRRLVGIVGAGTMGTGIAQVAVLRGVPVILYDVDPGQLERAATRVHDRIARLAARGELSDGEVVSVRGLLTISATLSSLQHATHVLEAVPEDLNLKQRVFSELDRLCPAHVVLATNTSSLSVTSIASATSSPERVVGMHFFNPAPRMALVEVVRAARTADWAVDATVALARSLGKTPVICQDAPGFLVNRINRHFYLEAIRLLDEEAISPALVDRVFREEGRFPMGPFELIDLIGLDVNLATTKAIFEASFGEPRFRPHPLQARMVQAGLLGRKSGRGFYRYDDQQLPQGAPQALTVTPAASPALKQVVILGTGEETEELAQACAAAGIDCIVAENADAVSSAMLSASELVIDASVWPIERKRSILESLASLRPSRAPLLTCCLAVSATEVASWIGQPSGLVGYGWIGPLEQARLVELARTPATDDITLVSAFFAQLSKATAIVPDRAGLVLPRTWAMIVNEAAFVLGEQLAAPADIDAAMRLGANHPFGPLEWADRVGLGRVVAILLGAQREAGEERYRVAPRLRRLHLCDSTAGRPGARSRLATEAP